MDAGFPGRRCIAVRGSEHMSADRVLWRVEFRFQPGRSALERGATCRLCPNACPIDPRPSSARSWTSPGALALALGAEELQPDELTGVFNQLAGCADVAGDGALRRAAELAVEVDFVAADGDAVRFGAACAPTGRAWPARYARVGVPAAAHQACPIIGATAVPVRVAGRPSRRARRSGPRRHRRSYASPDAT
jgi:hypothetical protein